MNTENQIKAVCEKFQIAGEYQSFAVLSGGHINSSYQVFFLRGGVMKDYILQKINTYVFHDPIAMMENISSVTEYIRAKINSRTGKIRKNAKTRKYT